MSKILIIGDIHGRTHWDQVYRKEQPDLTIFLGDYVSTHDHIPGKEQIKNLKNILEFKKASPEKVILLRGNHDMQHLGYSWAECSGLDYIVLKEMTKIKDEFLSNTQWVYLKDNIIFSHAGVSAEWMSNSNILKVTDINDLEPSEVFGFTPCKMSDYTGISATQPCTWIRPQALMEYAVYGYDQVVGHTPVRHIADLKDLDQGLVNHIWLCDNFDQEYLVYENDEFTIKSI